MYDFIEKFNSWSKIDSEQNDSRCALQCIVNNPNIDMCFSQITKNVVPDNKVIQKNKDGKFFIEIELSKDTDFVTNFNFLCENKDNVNIELYCYQGERELCVNINSDLILLYLCAAFMRYRIRFTFDEMPFEVKYSYDAYYLQSSLRREVADYISEYIKVNDMVYHNGMMKQITELHIK